MKYIYILLLSLVFVACGNSEKNNDPIIEEQVNTNKIVITKQQFESEKMQLGTLTEQVFNQTVKVNGMIDVPPQNKASVSTFIGGYITKTPLLIGDKVKRGQLVVTLENTEFIEIQQHYLEVAEQLNYLKSEFIRQQTLYNEKITSQKNYLKAESTYKSALALYNGLRKKLTMMNINPMSVEQGKLTSTINLYAPIDGYVTKVNVSNGTYVSSANEIIEIINTNHIHLELSVFEKDILKIKKDQPINFKVPESTNKIYDADVHLVGTSIDETSRTIKVHGHIHDDANTIFIMGMFVEAEIITDTQKSLALPKDAIAKIENNYYALVLNNQKEGLYNFDKVTLKVGKQTEDYIEVLNSNDFRDKEVLIKGGFMLLAE
ncbi:MAG: efflux RND transporter periplasmic adaptor subunit [Bacteroidetes bacterium]|nr:efflux RND transporter periplasmic adaptor subunit [Bacteroidota bacterium]